MDKLKVNHGAGLGIVEHWAHLQNGILNAFKQVLSNLTAEEQMFIISGINASENDPDEGDVTVTIQAGVICFNGEPIPVEAQVETRAPDQVAYIVVEDIDVDVTPVLNQTSGQGETVMTHRRGILTVGSNYPLDSEHCKIDAPTMNSIYKQLVGGTQLQIGHILPYHGAMDVFDATGKGLVGTTMEGFGICNGNTYDGISTPDLRGLAIVGAVVVPSSGAGSLPNGVEENTEPGDVFGKEKHVLTSPEMPAHKHTYTTIRTNASGVSHSGMSNSPNTAELYLHDNDTGTVGGDQPHENRQPSKALVMVMVIA